MANKLIRADYDIKNILGDTHHFKKIRVYYRIRKLRKELYCLNNKSQFFAYDIVNLCMLINTGKLLQLCDLASNNIKTSIINGNGSISKWPVVGLIDADIDGLSIRILAHMDSELDRDGQIDMTWIVDKKEDDSVLRSKSYTYSNKEISEYVIKDVPRDISNLFIKLYMILPNIFTIFIENILDGLKERYLK